MRTISATAETARSLARPACVYGVKITFPAPVGAKYYTAGWAPSDVDAADLRKRVLGWGELSAVLSGREFAKARFKVTIGDADGELRGWFESHLLQRLAAVVYQALWTPGEAAPATTDAVELLEGTLVLPPEWEEGLHAFRFEVTDLSVKKEAMIGVRVTKEEFDGMDPADEGRAVPIVYGQPDRVKGIGMDLGPRTRLREPIDEDDTELYVDDAREFPQGEQISLRVDDEIINGSFAGNKFTVVERGVKLYNSATTADSFGNCSLIDHVYGPTQSNCEVIGWRIEAAVLPDPTYYFRQGAYSASPVINYSYFSRPPSDGKQGREIIRYDALTSRLEWRDPFVIEDSIEDAYKHGVEVHGYQVRMKRGTPYCVRTFPEAHDEGALVCRWRAEARYVVGLGECAVRAVYVHGVRRRPITTNLVANVGTISKMVEFLRSGSVMFPITEPEWIPVPPEYYTSGATQVDGKVTTRVTLSCRPTALPGYEIDSDEILVDLTGPVGCTTPPEIIHDIFASCGIAMDVTALNAANARLANWKMSFAREGVFPMTQLVADLAFQSRSRIRWLGTAPELVVLHVDGGAADLTVGPARVVQDSVVRSREDLELAASEVEVRWRENDREKTLRLRDAAAEAALGRKVLSVDCWAYQTRHSPTALARFLLNRSKHLHNVVTLEATVFACQVEPPDIVAVDLSDLFASAPVPGEVQATAFCPDRGGDDPDRVRLVLRQHRWDGCTVACEGACESMGCETDCESAIEPANCGFGCEATCEMQCEAGCVNANEGLCGLGCEAGCQMGCEVHCTTQTIIAEWGCGVCESDESWWCESGCETDCETGGEA